MAGKNTTTRSSMIKLRRSFISGSSPHCSSEKVLPLLLLQLLSISFFLMQEQVSADISTKAATGKPLESITQGGFVVLPLIPSHAQQQRIRRERSLGLSPDEYSVVFPDGDSINYENSRDHNTHLDNDLRLRRREEAQQIGALYQGYGTHYVDLWCGTPPQRQTVIVDTGSGVTAFPCSGCTDCGVPDYHIDRLFSEKDSSTFYPNACLASSNCISSRSHCTKKECSISMSYAEGSRWNAYEGVDRCYVAGPHEIPLMASAQGDSGNVIDDLNPTHAADLAFELVFGCQTLVTGLFKTQLADGIMGMSNRPETFWKQMFDAGKLGSDQAFALCYSRQPTAERKGTESGALTLGGVDKRLHQTPMVFTPNASSGRDSFFSVKVRRFMLREGRCGESVKSTNVNPNDGVHVLDVSAGILNQGGVIVDSGTTDTYWNSGIGTEFRKIYKEISGGKDFDNKAVHLSNDELMALPTILLQLESDHPETVNPDISDVFHTAGMAGALDPEHPSDIILAIPPSHYMEFDPSTGTYIARFYASERSGTVLGANAIMGHDVFFDVDSDRIGWAESSCDYTSLVQGNGYHFEITGDLKPPEMTGADGDLTPVPPPAMDCESFSSGAKCQSAAGCSWYWGKCTKTQPPDQDNDNDDGSGQPPSVTPSDTAPTADNSQGSPYAGACSSPTCWVPIVAGLMIALLIVCFLFYLCCCGQVQDSENHKYSRAPIEPVEIELANGQNGGAGDLPNGSNHSDSFRDEPVEQPSNGTSAGRTSKRRRTSKDSSLHSGGSYRDEPEFEGDFA